MSTEFKRLERLAKEKGWDLPNPLDCIVPWFRYWKDKEAGKDVTSPKNADNYTFTDKDIEGT